MAISSRRPRRPGIDIWPGFVDALSQLVMVIVFVLLIFTAGQFYLTDALSGRDAALQRLTQQINQITDMLALERRANADLRLNLSQLSAQLQSVNGDRDTLTTRMAELQGKVTDLQTALEKSKASLAQAQGAVGERDQRLQAAQSTVDQLNQQLLALREKLQQIAAALDASEAKNKDQQVQVADLGRRLNAALATKVAELSRYRSEFFGRLRKVLGDRSDIRIVGDRFVFQSEVLFPEGSADLTDAAKQQHATVAAALKAKGKEIPTDNHWVLSVEGYTDKRPISTPQFPSNWELSTARAISVVRFFMSQGIPPDELAAAGFGQYQPIDPRDTPDAYRRNRRIELKLTER
jgi:chemotaxis protein MotB